MRGTLTSKETRTVYGEKVVRIQVDVDFDEIEKIEEGGQDLLRWLDNNVDSDININIGPFEDESQVKISEADSLDPNGRWAPEETKYEPGEK